MKRATSALRRPHLLMLPRALREMLEHTPITRRGRCGCSHIAVQPIGHEGRRSIYDVIATETIDDERVAGSLDMVDGHLCRRSLDDDGCAAAFDRYVIVARCAIDDDGVRLAIANRRALPPICSSIPCEAC